MMNLYIEEIFSFDKKWYGVLRCRTDENFKHYVSITKIHSSGYDWMTVNPTLESVIKHFYEDESKKEK